ncbi:hypothetical protein [Pedobacter ginsengisoli]|uniref:hypothetical protein n=1 Tax=Pedobacter ginsengisoli TaxID=363852 RepID=UPI00254E6D2B|nr:hypothetical protein [Pedobacter ginsengisoli]
MKRKLKLAFDQLEKELAVIPQTELSFILGGNGSGSSGSSGLTWNSSVDEVVDYLQDQGFPMSQDSSGNYYFSGTSGAIMLDEVVIVGQAPSSSGSSGSSGFNYSGYFSSGNSILDYYTAYFAAHGYSFTPTGGGNYVYTPPPPPPPASNDDPWKKDASGKIIKTPTGRTLPDNILPDVTINGEKMTFREVTIKTADGDEITAYEVTEVRDSNGNLITIEDRHKSNCTGFAFANGEVWIFDSDLPGDETTAFNDVLTSTDSNSPYSIVPKEQADYAIIWDTPVGGGPSSIVHSGIINSDGSYTSKNNNAGVVKQTEEQFHGRHIQGPNSNYVTNIVYYKRN